MVHCKNCRHWYRLELDSFNDHGSCEMIGENIPSNKIKILAFVEDCGNDVCHLFYTKADFGCVLGEMNYKDELFQQGVKIFNKIIVNFNETTENKPIIDKEHFKICVALALAERNKQKDNDQKET